MDPLSGSSWSRPETVAGFVRSPPNQVLIGRAARERVDRGATRLCDIGCGAGRNAVPLALDGWTVAGTDLSWPMLIAARERARQESVIVRTFFTCAPMDHLPFRDASFDFVIAHGIWNLARSSDEFRRAVAEAGRVARPGAALFVFTFSRHTLADDVRPIPGEPFVFTEFSGQPQCFLTENQLTDELERAGFSLDPVAPIVEYNRASARALSGGAPVIYEALFRKTPR